MLAMAALVLIGIAMVILRWTGELITSHRFAPADFPHRFRFAWVETPSFEEGIHRVAICVPLAARRTGPGIAVSGVVCRAAPRRLRQCRA